MLLISLLLILFLTPLLLSGIPYMFCQLSPLFCCLVLLPLRLCLVQTTLLHTSAAQAFYSSPNSVDQAPTVTIDFNASVYANVYYSNTMILLPHTQQVISFKLSYTNYLYWKM